MNNYPAMTNWLAGLLTSFQALFLPLTGGTLAGPGNLAANGNVVVAGTLAGNGNTTLDGNVIIRGANPGMLRVVDTTGAFATLQLGAGTAAGGVRLTPSNAALSLQDGTGAATVKLAIGGTAGFTAIDVGTSQGNFGEITITRNAGDAMRFNPTVNSRWSSDGQFGFASGSAVGTARDVSFYRSAAGVIGVNNGSGTSANGSMAMLVNTIGGCNVRSGSGSPNSAVVGSPCDVYLNTAGGAATTLYVKESGSATNTGWVAK